jgi:hypothetical protein
MVPAVQVASDLSTDPGELDYSGAVLRAKRAEALFVYLNEEESARALRELKKPGYDKPIIGETTLTGQKVIELARDAANLRRRARGPDRRCAAAGYQGLRREVPEGVRPASELLQDPNPNRLFLGGHAPNAASASV